MQHAQSAIHIPTSGRFIRSECHSSALPPRISPQNLKSFSLPQSIFRSLHPLSINNTRAPPTDRLEPLPPNLCNRRTTTPALALLLLEARPDSPRTLLFETPRADPPPAIPLRRIRAFASTRFVSPVELFYERR